MIFYLLMQAIDADEVRKIITTNDASVQGILLGLVIALMVVVVVLYRKTEKMQAEYIKALNGFTEQLLKVNKDYGDYVSNIIKYQNYVRDKD